MMARFSPSQSEMEHGVKQYDKEQVKMVSEFFRSNVGLWCKHNSLKNEMLSLSWICCGISANNFLQSNDTSLQIAKCYLRMKLTCFMFLVELNRLDPEFKTIKIIKQILSIYFVHLFYE